MKQEITPMFEHSIVITPFSKVSEARPVITFKPSKKVIGYVIYFKIDGRTQFSFKLTVDQVRLLKKKLKDIK